MNQNGLVTSVNMGTTNITATTWDEVLFISRDESVVKITKSVDDKCILKATGRGNTVVDVTMKIGTRSYKMSCEITVKGPYLNYSRCYLYIGNTQKVKVCDKKGTLKWSTSNKKILTVKNGKITAKKTGVATLKCKVNGITIKKKVTVHKNVYTQPSAKIKDMLLDRIYYHVVKTYFSGNKLKVKIKLYNTYTDRKLKVIKALDVKIYANGGCLHQRVINKKVNMKAYSSKTITVTVSKNSKMKHTIDLRN